MADNYYNYSRPEEVSFVYDFADKTWTSPDIYTLARIDETQLNREMAAIAPELAYWGAVAVASAARVRATESEFDVWKANWDARVRAELGSPDSKIKLTEKAVESEIIKNPEYAQWQLAINAYTVQHEHVLSLCAALRTKSVMLSTLAGVRRSESEAYRRTDSAS